MSDQMRIERADNFWFIRDGARSNASDLDNRRGCIWPSVNIWVEEFPIILSANEKHGDARDRTFPRTLVLGHDGLVLYTLPC